MRCPRCNTAIDFAALIKEAQDEYWSDAKFGPMILAIECLSDECAGKTPIMMMNFFPTVDDDEWTEIEGPDGITVQLPTQMPGYPLEDQIDIEDLDGNIESKQ